MIDDIINETHNSLTLNKINDELYLTNKQILADLKKNNLLKMYNQK